MKKNIFPQWLALFNFCPINEFLLLRDWEKSFLSGFQTTNNFLLLVEPKDRKIYYLPSFFSLLGYTSAQAQDLRPVDLLHPDDLTGLLKSLHHPIVFRIRAANREWLPMETSVFQQRTKEHRYWVLIARNISSHKQVQDSLRKSEELLRAVVETAVDGIITINERGIVLSANPAVERIFGYSPEEIIGRNVNRLMPEPDRSRHDGYLANYLSTGEKKIIGIGREVMGRRKSGALFPLDLAVSESIVGGQHIFTGLVRDITERKQAERRIKELNETLEHRVRERTEALRSYQQKLQNMALGLTRAEFRERRRISVDLHDQLAQYLVVARLRVGRLVQQIESAPLLKQIQEVNTVLDDALKYTRAVISDLSPNILYDAGLELGLKWLGGQMQVKGLKVHVTLEGEVIRLLEEMEMQIFEVVREILNGILLSQGGGEVCITLNFQAQTLTIQIQELREDSTEKIAAENTRVSLEQEFFITQERVRSLGGKIETSPLDWSPIWAKIVIPLRPEILPEEVTKAFTPLETPIERLSIVPSQEDEIRVMIADDHALLREGLRKVIEFCPKFRLVGEATNGEEAVELARSLHPDVVVMDVNMPRMNGIDATRHIKRLLPNTTIIGLSVHDEESIIRSMKLAGASDFVTKGAAPEEICHVILTQLTA